MRGALKASEDIYQGPGGAGAGPTRREAHGRAGGGSLTRGDDNECHTSVAPVQCTILRLGV